MSYAALLSAAFWFGNFYELVMSQSHGALLSAAFCMVWSTDHLGQVYCLFAWTFYAIPAIPVNYNSMNYVVCLYTSAMCLILLAVISIVGHDHLCICGWGLQLVGHEQPAGTCYSGTGMGTNLYPSTGMGFLTGVVFIRGHEYGLVVPSGYVPVAILSWDNMQKRVSWALAWVAHDSLVVRAYGATDMRMTW